MKELDNGMNLVIKKISGKVTGFNEKYINNNIYSESVDNNYYNIIYNFSYIIDMLNEGKSLKLEKNNNITKGLIYFDKNNKQKELCSIQEGYSTKECLEKINFKLEGQRFNVLRKIRGGKK